MLANVATRASDGAGGRTGLWWSGLMVDQELDQEVDSVERLHLSAGRISPNHSDQSEL